jgi:hypothetical protein
MANEPKFGDSADLNDLNESDAALTDRESEDLESDPPPSGGGGGRLAFTDPPPSGGGGGEESRSNESFEA